MITIIIIFKNQKNKTANIYYYVLFFKILVRDNSVLQNSYFQNSFFQKNKSGNNKEIFFKIRPRDFIMDIIVESFLNLRF